MAFNVLFCISKLVNLTLFNGFSWLSVTPAADYPIQVH